MLPRLSKVPQLSPIVCDYLDALKKQHFSGDIATDYASRLSLATDNSVYQTLPQAILFPKNIADVVRLSKLANKAPFESLSFTPRGGGTGTNGQSLNNNIIVDLSRHMTNILEINVQERWVRVQAGVVKDQLNQFLKPYGLFFAPELSTSNRATLGGMINTDASGQGSLQYGKTSNHVLALRSVLISGEILETQAIKSAYIKEEENSLTKEVFERCLEKRAQILKDLPQLNRFLTGYDLKNVFNDDLSEFNLSRLITGSEGSLAFVCEAKLNLLPIPQFRTLINIKYDSFDAALRSAPFLVEANALSVETIDSKVLNLAKQDIIWHSVNQLLTEEETPILGLNIVEFAGNVQKPLEQRINALCRALDEKIAQRADGIIGYQICNDLTSIERIYAMRKKAVGLLGNSKGPAKPIPFVEDTCVPPQHLADYISEFRALLDSHQLQYGMFGHVDAGVLHVRPALDLCDKAQVQLFKEISDKVADLTAKYGGLLWGEHGKGVRSHYAETFFTPELWQELRYIKSLFDPKNRLNPGKICTPLDSKDELYSILAPMRADKDREIPIAMREEFKGAMNCNGNGLCFNFDEHSTMCPSMKVSRNRVFSPKGRAAMVREWLNLMAQQNVRPEALDFHQSQVKLRDLAARVTNTLGARRGEYDFSHEVKAAMDTCLACKACASQCPIKIDVPSFRAKFFYFYHQRYLRPLKDHVVANLELSAPWLAKAPQFFNRLTRLQATQTLVEKTLGLTDLPQLSVPNLQNQLQALGYQEEKLASLSQKSVAEKAQYLLIVQDPYTSYYDAQVVADFVSLCLKLGFKPILVPFKANGKAMHIKGFLKRFTKTAQAQAKYLNQLNQTGIPLVGVDPAIVLSYRDEYQEILGKNRGNFEVLTAHEWLLKQLPNLKLAITTQRQWQLFPHCTEATALPASPNQWAQIFAAFGQELSIAKVGCCGMAGVFGHEVQNQQMSRDIYDISWGKKLHNQDLAFCLATGYSCRSQAKRFQHHILKHPVQALLQVLEAQ